MAKGVRTRADRKLVGTPDGQAPALESICDVYEGNAKGLCVSFCEANDCNVKNTPGCDDIKAKFVKVSGKAALPCEGGVIINPTTSASGSSNP